MSNPHVHLDDDKAMSIEWVFENARFGVCFDVDVTDNESGWWYVSQNAETGELDKMINGKLPDELVKLLRSE